MNKIEFEELQQEVASSGMILKSFLAEKKIPYSNYNLSTSLVYFYGLLKEKTSI